MNQPRQLLNSAEMDRTIGDMAARIAAGMDDPESAALIGIRTRGVPLAQRLHAKLKESEGWDLPLGILDITLYRDDLSTLGSQPHVRESNLPFEVDGRLIVLTDDVLYTGRTVRSAIEAIIDYGRPKAVRLAVLIDRGWREYPIQPDIRGMAIETAADQIVQVRFQETDGAEEALLTTKELGEA